MNIDVNRRLLFVKIIFIFLLFFGYSIRESFMTLITKNENHSIILNANYLLIFMMVIFLFKNLRLTRVRWNILIYFILIYLLNIFLRQSIGVKDIMFIMTVFIPTILLMLSYNLKLNKSEFEQYIHIVNKYYMVMMIVLVIGGVLWLINKDVYYKITDIFFSPRFKELIYNEMSKGSYRYYSILGHPLVNTQVSLIFLVISKILYYIDKNKYKFNISVILASIIILISASKTGFVLLVAFYLFFYVDIRKVSVSIVSVSVIALLFLSGLFSTVLNRFVIEDISTGRFDILKKLTELQIDSNFFEGYGSGYSAYLASNINTSATSFEFPIIIWGIDLGWASTICIILICFIMPSIYLIKHKKYNLFIMISFIFIDINTYNGVTDVGDSYIYYCIIVFLIILYARYKDKLLCDYL